VPGTSLKFGATLFGARRRAPASRDAGGLIVGIAPGMCVAALLLLAHGGCNQRPESSPSAAIPATQLSDDSAALSRVRAIQTNLAETKSFQPEEVESLRALAEQYPDTPEVVSLLTQALLARNDWNGLVTLHSRKPPAQRSDAEQVYLAKLLINGQRFEEAEQLLEPLIAAHPEQVEWAWLTAYSAYSKGAFAQAGVLFDRHWNALLAYNAHDCIVLRGLIYYHLNQPERALELLERAPSNLRDTVTYNNTLGRVLAATGQTARAQVYLDRAKQLSDAQGEYERRLMRLSAQSRTLNDAMLERRFVDAERIISEMLALADKPTAARLYPRLAEIYRATGRADQAARVDALGASTEARDGK